MRIKDNKNLIKNEEIKTARQKGRKINGRILGIYLFLDLFLFIRAFSLFIFNTNLFLIYLSLGEYLDWLNKSFDLHPLPISHGQRLDTFSLYVCRLLCPNCYNTKTNQFWDRRQRR